MNMQDICQDGDWDAIINYSHNGRDVTEVFGWLCCYNRLVLAQRLIDMYPDINVHNANEWAFRSSCGYGYLVVTQWLLAICPSINVHDIDDFYLLECCGNGHLAMIQWLVVTCPSFNIYANLEIFTCCQRHQPVVEFLVSQSSHHDDIQYRTTGTHGYIYTRDLTRVWTYVYVLEYGYLHYGYPGHLSNIIAHHEMTCRQLQQKSARSCIKN